MLRPERGFRWGVEVLHQACRCGLVVGLVLAWHVALETGQIMIPGALVGLIVGYATARYGDRPATQTA